MTAIRALAAVLIVVGGILLWYGNNEQKGLRNQASELLLGESTRDVTVFYVTGGGAIVIGVLGLILGGRRK